ncbi:MAG TPA: hypothetical protein VKX45_17770 [Bryobacteraceae bacterium]|nr:hypothetical protein [Bryobacteraceae bacterium]
MKRHFRFLFWLAVCGMPLQGATLERLSMADMIARSTAIVRGKVTGSTAAFSGPVIYTHYTVQVTEALKGTASGTVDVVLPGGVAQNLRQSFAGTPTLDTGAEYVLFLYTGKSGLTTIVGLTQGLFTLNSAAAGDPTATRTATRELMLDRATGRPVKDDTLVMKMSSLRAQIAAALQGAAK